MDVDTQVVSGLLKQVGAKVHGIRKFEGNKLLVTSREDPARPDYFFKPVPKVDPLSSRIMQLRAFAPAPKEVADLNRIAALPIAHDRETGYLFYEFFAESKPLKALLADRGAGRADLLATVALALAEFHTKASVLLDRQSVPAVDVHDVWPNFMAPTITEYANGSGADYPVLIRYLQGFEGLGEAVACFRSSGFDPAICHGDFKFDNVLVRGDGAEIRLIDFNDLIKYDRHYDLGVAASELISLWLAEIDYSDIALIGEAIGRAEPEFQGQRQLIRHFLACYAHANPNLQISGERIAYFAGRALIHNAMGSLYLSSHLSRYHWACLHVGANMVANFSALGDMFSPSGEPC